MGVSNALVLRQIDTHAHHSVNDGAALGRVTAHDENLELVPGLVQGSFFFLSRFRDSRSAFQVYKMRSLWQYSLLLATTLVSPSANEESCELGDLSELVALRSRSAASLTMQPQSTEGHTAFGTARGAPKFQFEPIEFEGFKRHSVVQIAAGNDHFLALTSTGYVFACGRGEQDQLGRRIVARVSLCSSSRLDAS